MLCANTDGDIISVTKGIVTRVEPQKYSHSSIKMYVYTSGGSTNKFYSGQINKKIYDGR